MKVFSKIDDNVWIDTSEDTIGNIRSSKIKPKGVDILIFSFIDNQGIPTIIFENVNGRTIKCPKLQTICISNRKYLIETESERTYLEISCSILEFKRYYYDFTNGLLSCLMEGFTLEDSFVKIYEEWKAFLSIRGPALTLEEQYGLLAELVVLKDLIVNFKPDVALKSWRGPFGELDFKFKNLDLEVKATLKKKHEHVVNGLDQLLRMKDKLGLLSFCLVRLETGGISLDEYVLKIEDLLKKYPASLLEFRKLLHDKLNYNIRDEDDYKSNRFEVKEVAYFDIIDSFPVFTSRNLSAPLNNNISKIEYTLDLTNLTSTPYHKTLIKDIIKKI